MADGTGKHLIQVANSDPVQYVLGSVATLIQPRRSSE
jgi:hypothetical protein